MIGGEDDGAMAKRRAARSLSRCTTIPNWARDPSATTISYSRKTSDRLQDAARRHTSAA